MGKYHRTRWFAPPTTIALATMITAGVSAQPCLDAKLVSADVAARDELGSAFSISGDLAAVATNTAGTGASFNSVYVFRRGAGGWSQEAKLITPLGFGGVDFGRSVAISRDVLVVGAIGRRSGDQGVAFVYRHDAATGAWRIESVLAEPEPGGDAAWAFGYLVGIVPTADAIVVVSSEFSRSGEIIQPAHIYRPGVGGEPWGREAAVPIVGPGAQFLWNPANWLDVDEGQFIGGNPGPFVGSAGGEARIHRFDSDAGRWVVEAIMRSPDGLNGSSYGIGVSIHGDVAAVVEPGDAVGFGAVHVYRRDADGAWPRETSIRGDETRHFSWDVAVQRDAIFISGRRATPSGPKQAVFAYRHDGSSWLPDDFAYGDGLPIEDAFFGRRIDADATNLIVASEYDSEAEDFGGAAYVFGGVPGDDCNRNGIPDACDLLDGTSPDANGNGVPDECDPPVCEGAEATVYVDLHGIVVGGPLDGHRYFGVLIGTPASDVIVGTEGDDLIIAGRGDDTVCDGGGSDRIISPRGGRTPAAPD